MLQKIIRVGNSLAVTLPRQFTDEAKYKAGDVVHVETNASIKSIYVRPSSANQSPGLTPEFKTWLDDVIKNEADIIKSLAKV